jgi:hypothetical protein
MDAELVEDWRNFLSGKDTLPVKRIDSYLRNWQVLLFLESPVVDGLAADQRPCFVWEA